MRERAERRVAIVTGAGSGIGREVATQLLDRGHAVVLCGRTAATLQRAAKGRTSSLCVVADVRDSESIRYLVRETVEHFGRVDVLFNNAGILGPETRIDHLDDADWKAVWETNVSGYVYCAREVVRAMLQQNRPGGRIINNASIASRSPRLHGLAYAVSKAAITGLTRSLSLDLRGEGITVTQLDVGNAFSAMTQGSATSALQPDGVRVPEPTIDVAHVAALVCAVVDLPVDVAVPELMIMAREMPYFGRG